ncbi:MAG: hypothetical protein CMJ30_07895 [Phycisphaerae bacterium]|nr:hypothetical protein [Phycisphaerae bacterium]
MNGWVWHNASWWPIFAGLVGVGAMVLILNHRLRRKQRSLVPGVFGSTSSSRSTLSFLGSLLVGVAVLDPRWSSETIELPFRGRNVVVLLDASRSMRCQDAAPDRLEVAKTILGELAESAVGDRFGLIAFAGSPVPKCPPTADPRAFRRALRQVDPDRMPVGGSLPGDALREAASFLTDDRDDGLVLLVSDGDDMGSWPVEAARGLGVPVVTITLGDAERGARIPDNEGGWVVYDDSEVWSVRNDKEMKALSQATGGIHVPLGTSVVDAQALWHQRLAPLVGGSGEVQHITMDRPEWRWFAVPGVLLLGLGAVGRPRIA